MPEVVTANRLADGVVVFQTAEAGWSDNFADAEVLPDAASAKDALARAKEDEAQNLVVDAYVIAVESRNGHLAPKALREAIRAAGPTIRRDLGKQAEGLAPRSAPAPFGG